MKRLQVAVTILMCITVGTFHAIGAEKNYLGIGISDKKLKGYCSDMNIEIFDPVKVSNYQKVYSDLKKEMMTRFPVGNAGGYNFPITAMVPEGMHVVVVQGKKDNRASHCTSKILNFYKGKSQAEALELARKGFAENKIEWVSVVRQWPEALDPK